MTDRELTRLIRQAQLLRNLFVAAAFLAVLAAWLLGTR